MAFSNSKQALTNPVSKFLDWEGKDSKGFFTSYDKATKQKVTEEIFQFSIIDVWYAVKWYYQANDAWIYSNEIKDFSEKIRVMSSKKGEPTQVLWEGRWKNIKDSIKWLGWDLHLCITYLDLADGAMKEFSVKWNAYYNFSQLLKQLWWDGNAKVLEYKGALLVEGKAFNYNEAEFVVTEEVIWDNDQAKLEEFADQVDEYYEELRMKYKDDDSHKEDSDDQDEPKWADEPATIQGDAEFEAEVKAESKWPKAWSMKPKEEEISVEDIPF